MIVFSSRCKDCEPPKRTPYCHTYCPNYLESKREHEERLEQQRKENKGRIDAFVVMEHSRQKTIRKNHDRKFRK